MCACKLRKAATKDSAKTQYITAKQLKRRSIGRLGPDMVVWPRLTQAETALNVSSIGKHLQPVSTDRQSASMGDLDRKSELERRVEDGIHYEHDEFDQFYRHFRQEQRVVEKDGDIPAVRGIFCGYRRTNEDYQRLKSANIC